MRKLLLAIICVFGLTSGLNAQDAHKLKVIATLFPLYDFTRSIASEKAEVSLLLPPGVEPHHFEPSPKDILRIAEADIFIYTGPFMEPWVADILKGINKPDLLVIDASRGITLLTANERHEDEPGHGAAGVDPHIWLDFGNDKKIIDNIASGLIAKDPQNKESYLKSSEDYKLKLDALDTRYAEEFSGCTKGAVVYAGHAAFGYLAKKYGLEFIPANPGFSSESEPSPKRLAELTDLMRRRDLKAVYCERLSSCRLAETIAGETKTRVMFLNPGHNLTRDQMQSGMTFLQMMEDNLASLKEGLGCRKR